MGADSLPVSQKHDSIVIQVLIMINHQHPQPIIPKPNTLLPSKTLMILLSWLPVDD